MTRPDLALARELEAALAFWQAAGVSHDFHDDATAWLAEAPLAPAPEAGGKRPGAERRPAGTAPTATPAAAPRERAATPAPAPATARANLLGDSPPADLATFRDWWMKAPGIAPAQTYPRIAPRGEAGAALLVLVPQPEEADRARLLEGPQGRLLANILAAMGLEESAVYVAAALPCHTPMADLPALAAGGMDRVTAHHIALAAPERVLVLGTALAPLLGSAGAESLREINQGNRKVPVMASETLEAMLHSPTLKARFWRRWMEWSAST
jgi:DNA polymerase